MAHEKKKHDHVELIFNKNKLIFNDPRRFGSIHITNNINEHFLIKNLGVEPLDEVFNEDYLYTKQKESSFLSVNKQERYLGASINHYVLNSIVYEDGTFVRYK